MLVALFPACPLPEFPLQLKADAPEELRRGCPAEGRGMLAGGPSRPGAGAPRLAWQDEVLSPTQLQQQGELCGAAPSTAPHFCSEPVVVCSSLSRSLCPHARSCCGLSRTGTMPRPVRGGAGCSGPAVLGPRWKRGQPLIHTVLAVLFLLSSPGLTPLFLTAGLFFLLLLLFFSFSLSAFLCGWSWQE